MNVRTGPDFEILVNVLGVGFRNDFCSNSMMVLHGFASWKPKKYQPSRIALMVNHADTVSTGRTKGLIGGPIH